MSYQWDIFLSYPRAGAVGEWVHNHFLPLLNERLIEQLPHDPRIFVDQAQATGVDWPNNLKQALLHSRILVAVWTPPYFRSAWCTAEWNSMLAREEVMRRAGLRIDRGLVYPIVYSDGKHFDEKARRTQFRRDLSQFTYPYLAFRESAAYLDFHDAMRSIAEELEEHLVQVPEWQADWPITMPNPTSASPLNLVKI